MATSKPSHLLPTLPSLVGREKLPRSVKVTKTIDNFSPEEKGAVQQLVNLSSDSSDSEQSPVKKKQSARTPSTPITLEVKVKEEDRPKEASKSTPPPPSPPSDPNAVKMIGTYTPRSRKKLLEKYMAKRKRVCNIIVCWLCMNGVSCQLYCSVYRGKPFDTECEKRWQMPVLG